ncbi:MAG TPA: PAS domain S-box protein [Gemmatimonadota bacterium]|nr:PAS domain S-box protein [Gemmatimonadota bacterium]
MDSTTSREDASLQAAEYRAVFDSAPDGILLVDEKGTIRDVNPRALALFGYEADELVGRKIEVLVPLRARDAHVAEREAYMADPRARPMGVGLDLHGRRKDGSEFPVEISLSPMREGEARRVICMVRDETERHRLRAFGVGALRAAEEERQRIARELHDDTAQRLAALMMMLKVAGRIEEREERERRIDQVREAMAEAAEGVRRIAQALRPPALDEAGLVVALDSLVRSLRRAHAVDIELSAAWTGESLDPDAELALYRIVQEALSNALRHSGASRVAVSLDVDERTVRVGITDDGRGFPVDQSYGEDGHGLGLVGMRERARNAGGMLEIESAPGEGTRVRVELPVRRRPR